MNLLILGTSNSILTRGWSHGLAAALPNATIENLSFGSSPCSQFAWAMGRDFSKFDYVFFDTVPNDEKLGNRVGNDQYFDRILFELLSTIASQTRLIVLGFCLDALVKETPIHAKRRAFASALGAQFVSMRELSLKYGRSIIGDDAPLFESEAHPDRRIAFLVGIEIGRSLRRLRYLMPSRSRTALNYSNNFHHDELVSTNAFHRVVNRRNRLVDVDLIEVDGGDFITLDPSRRCIGIYINRHATCCTVRYEATNDHVVRLYSGSIPEAVEIVFVPLRHGITSPKLHIIDEPHDASREDLKSMPVQMQAWKALYWDGNPNNDIDLTPSGLQSQDLQKLIEDSFGRAYGEPVNPALSSASHFSDHVPAS